MKNSTVVSLFSGGGGLDLGFVWADFNIIWANDNDINAVDTYRLNIGNHIFHEDINKINPNLIPKADVVIGGPPCQSFSLAGNRNPDDSRGELVWKYIDIINHIKPKIFVFENVSGLISAKDKNGNKILPQIEKAFIDIGYSIYTKLLNSADYGVPQLRKRLIILGTNIKKEYTFPKAIIENKNYITVLQALGDLPAASESINELNYLCDPLNDFQRIMRKNSYMVRDHKIPNTSDLDKYIISHVKPGGNYMDIPTDVASIRIKRLQTEGGHTTCYGRMHPDKPSYTINTHFNRPNLGSNIHYKYDRLITVREALRLQSFPDDYNIKSSSKKSKNSIIGNAVPPLLAYYIAISISKYLKESEK